MAEKILHHTVPITAMAFNGDCSMLALALANNNVEIYQYNGRSWSLMETLTKHLNRVTGIDWAPRSNKIVTCSADRNAYVWEPIQGKQGKIEWNPILVILRISRAATCIKWSPNENKFAVGSAARQASICYYMPEQFCWVSKHIKKPIKSTVTCIDWHPNNYIVAVGSSDNHCRVYSAFIKDVEEKGTDKSWGGKMAFGNPLCTYKCNGWITAVSFSASGDHLAFAAQDSTLQIVAAQAEAPAVFYSPTLPLTTIEWATDMTLIAGGHDRLIFGFSFDGNSTITCDGKQSGKTSGGGFRNARLMFAGRDAQGTTEGVEVSTIHVAPINGLKVCAGEKGNVEKFATCSSDGKIYMWSWAGGNGLAGKLEALQI